VEKGALFMKKISLMRAPPSSFAKERGTGGEVGCRASRRAFCIIDKSREMCYNITSE
jgi:hypothetical protein